MFQTTNQLHVSQEISKNDPGPQMGPLAIGDPLDQPCGSEKFTMQQTTVTLDVFLANKSCFC